MQIIQQTGNPAALLNNVIAYAIEAVPAVAGVTRTQVFEAIRAQKLTARKNGRRTIIEADELRRWIATFPTKGRAPEHHQEAAA